MHESRFYSMASLSGLSGEDRGLTGLEARIRMTTLSILIEKQLGEMSEDETGGDIRVT